jgi:hypothetical protein
LSCARPTTANKLPSRNLASRTMPMAATSTSPGQTSGSSTSNCPPRRCGAAELGRVRHDRPQPTDMSPEEITVRFNAGHRVVEWDLGRTSHYSWRAGFVLGQLMALLERKARFPLVAVPGLLDAVLDDVIPRVPTHARLLLRTDLPGLNRHIGGHGAYDGAIERVLATREFGPNGNCLPDRRETATPLRTH